MALYAFLFDEFSKEHDHVEFLRSETSDFSELLASIKRLEDAGVLFRIFENDECVEVELDYKYAYDFIDLISE